MYFLIDERCKTQSEYSVLIKKKLLNILQDVIRTRYLINQSSISLICSALCE